MLYLKLECGIPGWCRGLAPAFGPGRDPGDPGSSPKSGSRCMEPVSPSAYVSASLSVSLMNKNKKIKSLKCFEYFLSVVGVLTVTPLKTGISLMHR